MSEQDSGQVSALQHPTIDDEILLELYWKQQGQPWRTEPEIDNERQKYLEERRHSMLGNSIRGKRKYIFPLKDIPLSRADIEWLLATHENGRGPIDWNDPAQRNRKGLDLYGVDLRGMNLAKLPLTNSYLYGANMEKAQAFSAQLQGANLEPIRIT